jgi:hypothetical protein
MKRISWYTLTLGFCLLMSCLHAGVSSNQSCNRNGLKKTCLKQERKVNGSVETADFILTNNLLLF